MAKAPEALALSLGLPGEALAVKVVDLLIEAIKGQPKDVREQMWRWFVRDLRRWRRFWKLDKDDELLREQSEAVVELVRVINKSQDVDLKTAELDVEFLQRLVQLLEDDVVPPGGGD